MSTNTQPIQPQGTPNGCQFADKINPESEVTLDAEQPVRMALPDDPTVTWSDGTKEWWAHGQLHRYYGPAVTRPDGTERWCIDGHLHRHDGPALTHPDGTELWWRHGKLHRENGPAVIRPNGTKEWWECGHRIR